MADVHTFLDLQNEVLRLIDEVDDTDTTRTLVKNFLNQAHQQRCASDPWPFLLWESVETFTCVVDQRVYPLHELYGRPFYFFNRATSQFLEEIPERELAASGVRWTTDEAKATRFRHAGLSCVRLQPTSASTISIVSSSASDTGAAKAITIQGEASTGLIVSEAITPTGTSTATSTTSFTKILAVTKGATWSGTLTMTSNSGAVTNLVLGAAEFHRRFPQIELLAAPTAADVIEYRFWRHPRKLTDDHDIPDLPYPHSQILVWDAALMLAGYVTDISDKSMVVWRSLQQQCERSLQEAQQEGQNLVARPRFVRNLEDEADADLPRAYLS